MEISYYQSKIDEKYKNEKLEIILFNGYKKSCKIKCKECNKVYSYSRFCDLLKKSKKHLCKDCGRRKNNKKRFYQSLKSIFPNESFEVLEYTNSENKAIIKCLTCGEIFSKEQATNFKTKKHLCNNCYPVGYDSFSKTKETFLDFICMSNNWELLDNIDDIKSNKKIKCKCLYCGKENEKTIYDYLKNIQCTCGRWDTKEKLIKAFDKEYKLLEECTTSDKRVKIQHSCGFIYSIIPHRFLSGYNRCPKCKKHNSGGETSIKNWLLNNNIDFEIEYPVMINSHLLRFDFYIPSIDKYIEFQGKQHFEIVDCWGGKEGYKKRLEYDNYKREYCKDKLLEITYKQINDIPKILFHLFNDYPEKEYTES